VINLGHPDALWQVYDSVNRGEMVGILGDRIAESDKITTCQFLGVPTRFPAGPVLLAATLKVPVLLFFGLYRGGNRYDIHFELLAEQIVVNREQRRHDIQYWTQRYVERLEYYLRQAPYNWFNFYDYWRE
jgi:predicted LPLAT superfamily acyltransferase